MKRLVTGILAHVDSGKTTLSEGMLYCSGEIRKLGRVDHKTSFLDTNIIERDRGITIFSKQAVLHSGETEITLLDTPGHIDFSAETERTLQVLDYAVLVINASDGVQNHTRTLWKLLESHGIPVFIFINKMDLPGTYRETLLKELKQKLSSCCTDFTSEEDLYEEAASNDEDLMQEYLEDGILSDESISSGIASRKIFPCFFGSALKMEGIKMFLDQFCRYTLCPEQSDDFAAKIYKISEDDQGNRLTHMKITGGTLKVKTTLSHEGKWEEKINNIRVYSGDKFQTVQTAEQGMICAVTGLTQTYAGEGLGAEADSPACVLEPVLTYKAEFAGEKGNINDLLAAFMKLEAEEPKLHVIWNEQLREIHVQVMGEMQLDVLKSIIEERFHMKIDFTHGNVAYKETIASAAEGVGHYEPLRHYAEVHLLLEPGERGKGMQFFTDCREEILDKNWQRLIMTHLEEKTHRGILTGSPLTDVKITVVSGRAHLKHTEGGDFRQATYRAVRNGLRYAEPVLLEPWYEFTLDIPSDCVGRAMSDLTRMSCEFSPPEVFAENAVISGRGPVSSMRGYHSELQSYSHGKGTLQCFLSGYEPCHNSDEVTEQLGYDCDRDTDNTADSVFCTHGAGFVVSWDEVGKYMHLSGIQGMNYGKVRESEDEISLASVPSRQVSSYRSGVENDKELMAIFERTYGKADPDKKRNTFRSYKENPADRAQGPKVKYHPGPGYLLVDGYNIIFSWDELKKIAKDNLDLAREMLINTLCNYQGIYGCEVILVFDAYRVKGNTGTVQKVHNINVIYTKEAETADTYIERTSHELSRDYRVRVATSDGLEQIIILGNGAFRISAAELYEEVKIADMKIKEFIRDHNK